MDLRTLKRWDLKFAIVTLLCLSGTVGGSYLLWLDVHESGSKGQGTPMATVVRKSAKVKRKTKASYAWSNVQLNEPIFKKDSVQTSVDSAAALKLRDGSILELGENSLVVLDEVGDLALNFQRGQAVLRTAKGDSRVSIGSDGKAHIEQVPVSLIKPEPLAELLTAERQFVEVAFAWNPRGAQNSQMQRLPEQWVIQLSRDEHFRGPGTKTRNIPDVRTTATVLSLDAGKYFWRILGRSGQQDTVLSPTSQFRVAAVEALKPSWPNTSEKIRSFGEESRLQFRWIMPKSVESLLDGSTADRSEHFLEVSRDPRFASQLVQEKIAPTNLVAHLGGLQTGSLYWRIVSHYGGLTLRSAVERFELEQTPTLGLELTYPEDGGTLPLRSALRFSWTSEATDIDYVWEVEDQQQRAVASEKVKGFSSEWRKPSPGTYRWRVTAYAKSQKIAESPWRRLAVAGGAPLALIRPERDFVGYYWKEPLNIPFEWTRDPLIEKDANLGYLVEVARNPEFSEILASGRTKGSVLASNRIQLSQKLRPQENLPLFWRVSVVDANGQALKKSESRKFVYGTYPLLRAPAAAKPEANSTINLLEQDGDPVLAWTSVDAAHGYQVTISQKDEKSTKEKVVLTTTTPKSAIVLKGIKPGVYRWSVRPIDTINRLGNPLEPRDFTITYGQPLPPPEPVSPEVQ